MNVKQIVILAAIAGFSAAIVSWFAGREFGALVFWLTH